MTERTLIKEFRRIVYEEGVDRDKINRLITTYNISQAENAKTIEEISIVCAAQVFNIEVEFMLSKTRKRECVEARQFIMHFNFNLPTYKTLNEIANIVGMDDHANVLHANRKIKGLLEVDKTVRERWTLYNTLIEDRI